MTDLSRALSGLGRDILLATFGNLGVDSNDTAFRFFGDGVAASVACDLAAFCCESAALPSSLAAHSAYAFFSSSYAACHLAFSSSESALQSSVPFLLISPKVLTPSIPLIS